MMDYDPKIIQTLVTNLIGNALKFTPEYGKIKVVAKVVTVAEGSTKNTPNSLFLKFEKPIITAPYIEFLSINFSDTGAGIPPKSLPHIFDRFFQVDGADNKMTYGTGIGLALVKELMELIGGTIKVESAINEGSQFTLLLPIRNTAPIPEPIIIHQSISSSATFKHTEKALAQKLTIPSHSSNNISKTTQPLLLIIEDNADVVYYLKECLQDQYKIILANNGKIGTTQAFEHIPDIILSDVMMPEMDGYELCSILKNDARTSHIPIILLTAKATIESKHKGLEMGAVSYTHLTLPTNREV